MIRRLRAQDISVFDNTNITRSSRMDSQRRNLVLGASMGGTIAAIASVRTVEAQSTPATINADAVEFTDPVASTPAPPYLRTVSDIINGEPVSVFRAIDKSKHAGIRAGTNSDDLHGAFNSLLTAMKLQRRGQLFIPGGIYNIHNTPLIIPEGISLHGENRASTVLRFTTGANTNALIFESSTSAYHLTVDGQGMVDGCFLVDGNRYPDGVGTSNVSIHDCEAYRAKYQGFALSRAHDCQLSSIRSIQAGSRGLLIDPNSYDNQVTDYYAKDCTNAALLIGHGSHGNVIRNVVARDTGNAAIWLTNNAFDNTVSGVRIMGTSSTGLTPGIFLSSNIHDNVISDFNVQGYPIGLLLRGTATVPDTYGSGDTQGNVISNGRLIGTGSSYAGSAAIKLDTLGSTDYRVVGNILQNIIASDYSFGLYDPTGSAAIDNRFTNIDLTRNIGTKFSLALKNTGNRLRHVDGVTPYGDLYGTGQPAVLATGIPVTNPYPFAVQVFVKGMPANGQVQIGAGYVAVGDSPNGGNGMYLLGPGQSITLNYPSGSPSWIWFGI